MTSQTAASGWLLLAQAQPDPPSIPHSAFVDYCRHLAMTAAMPSALALLERSRGGTDEDAKLARRLVANVAKVEDTLKATLATVTTSPALTRTEAGRVCLATVARAVLIDQTACPRGECCLTRLSSVPLITLSVTTPRSQSGLQKDTFVIATFLYHFVLAWMGVGGAAAWLAQSTQEWLAEQRGGIERLPEIPTRAQLLFFESLNRMIAYVTRIALCPGFVS